MAPSQGKHDEEGDNLINKNEQGDTNTKRHFDGTEASNVDPLKPQFERSDMNANQEQRAGSGGSGKTSDKNPSNR